MTITESLEILKKEAETMADARGSDYSGVIELKTGLNWANPPRWVTDKVGIVHCSNCTREAYWDTDYGQQKFDYCHYCGAYMKGVE